MPTYRFDRRAMWLCRAANLCMRASRWVPALGKTITEWQWPLLDWAMRLYGLAAMYEPSLRLVQRTRD